MTVLLENMAPDPLYFENFDLTNMVTPVDVDSLKSLLKQTNYDDGEMEFLLQGFRYGFDLGYWGRSDVQLKSPNLKLDVPFGKILLWNKIMKEVHAKRYAGPFVTIPYSEYIQSPVGLVPKDNGKDVRLIFHLLYPRGRGLSVNENTPTSMTKVTYPDFSQAIQMCMEAGKSCKIAKSDMKATFRNLGILPAQWRYLILKAESPLDGLIYYFVEKALVFGASISCSHFQRFSNAVAHVVRYFTKLPNLNYLDDYLFAALLTLVCNNQVRTFLYVCEKIRFPVSLDKTHWASTLLTFLGFLIDTENQVVLIPIHKIEKAVNKIKSMLEKPSKKTTLKQLQSICGLLNFFSRCIVPGRAFTRRLYAATAVKPGKPALKPHHHIKINQEMRLDLETWLAFLTHQSVFCHPFMDFSKYWSAEEVLMYSDASKNPELRFGAWCQTSWMYSKWDADFIKRVDPSIEYLELFALVEGVVKWIHRFKNCRIILYCDNQAVLFMLNKTATPCKQCMVLIHILVLHSMIHNV